MTEPIDRNKDFFDKDKDIIELTEILEEVQDDGVNEDQVLELTDFEDAAGEDAAGVDGTSVLTDESIEAALSRIIEKKYAQRLDTLFIEIVERVVEREIAAIKKSLFKDLS